MYQKIINKITELGDSLVDVAGNIVYTNKNQKWFTEKDLEIETELVNLINTFPGKNSIYAEEAHKNFIEEENIWVIDPISNTINFIHGMPHYAIVLSHIFKGETKFAIVYDPFSKEIFTAEKGKGTFLNNKRVCVSKCEEDTMFLIGPYIREPYSKILLDIILKMSKAGGVMRNIGSLGVHYAYVACGRSDVAFSFNEDIFPEFAGKLLVEEAGGKFTDFNGDIFNIKTRGVVASNGFVHSKVLNLIREMVS